MFSNPLSIFSLLSCNATFKKAAVIKKGPFQPLKIEVAQKIRRNLPPLFLNTYYYTLQDPSQNQHLRAARSNESHHL